jgi:hypothetical protein
MTLSWCFKVCCLVVLSTLATPAWSHPDLLQIEELDLALAPRPKDADLLARRGDLYRQHEDYAAAALDLAAARAAQPDYPLLDLFEAMNGLTIRLAPQCCSPVTCATPSASVDPHAAPSSPWAMPNRPPTIMPGRFAPALHALPGWSLALVAAAKIRKPPGAWQWGSACSPDVALLCRQRHRAGANRRQGNRLRQPPAASITGWLQVVGNGLPGNKTGRRNQDCHCGARAEELGSKPGPDLLRVQPFSKGMRMLMVRPCGSVLLSRNECWLP